MNLVFFSFGEGAQGIPEEEEARYVVGELGENLESSDFLPEFFGVSAL